MKKFPSTYTLDDMNAINDRIEQLYGATGRMFHEIVSEYVHTDVQIATALEQNTYATFGMGSRATFSPVPDFERIELVLHSTKEIEPDSEQCRCIGAELTSMSKVPFRNETWFGPGHTMNASKEFKKDFGYEYFIFADQGHTATLPDVGEVHFLTAIPIYEDEREWIVENDSFVFMDLLAENFSEEEIYNVDTPRAHFIPECDVEELQLMRSLDIDRETLYQLMEHLEKLEREGKRVDGTVIDEWLEKHRNQE